MSVENKFNGLTKQKTHILFILPSLHPGGAERVLSFLAQNLNKTNFETTLLVLYRPSDQDYEVKGISVHYLNKSRTLMAIPLIFQRIWKDKPDAVFTSSSQLNVLGGGLSLIFKKTKFVIRIASVYSFLNAYEDKKRSILPKVKKLIFRYVDQIICQSRDMYEDVKHSFGIPDAKLTIIGNPIKVGEVISTKRTSSLPKKQLITVGRLVRVKGHQRILSILATCNFDFHYIILGDGPERENVLRQIAELRLKDKVTHIPYTDQVKAYLLQSDLFLQGSFVEGFPNALLESMAVGTPAVAFDAPGGTKEIIENNKNGFRVQTTDDYRKKIFDSLFEHQWESQTIIRSIQSKFDSDIILKKYENIFATL